MKIMIPSLLRMSCLMEVYSLKIQSNSDLMISEHARVEADITADRIVIKGSVTGNVTAVSSIHIFPTGKLTGDITASEVILDSGSFFSGACTMTN